MKVASYFFFLCSILSVKADTWTQKSFYPGAGLELPISFSIGDKGYVGCGDDADDFWEYDPQTDSWTQKADVPGGNRRAGVGFSIGNKGYAGTGGGGLADFYQYDQVANSWMQKASLIAARSFATGFSIGEKGYIGCGLSASSSYLNDFWEYDPTSDTWTQKTSLPNARKGAVGFSVLGKGYITTGLSGGPLNDIWEYDPSADSWTEKATLPADGRTDASGFAICDKGYVMGGGEGLCYDDIWQFDPVNNLWMQKTNFPGGARDDGASFVIGNTGYFGLGQLAATTNTNDFWEYIPDDNCSPAVLNFSASETSLCEKFCIDFSDQSSNNPTAWQWIFPGGTPAASTDQHPSQVCYQLPGVYEVTLITSNAIGNDTLTLTNYITVYPTPPFPTITQNGYTLTSSLATGYQWQLNTADIPGATDQSYDVQQSGYYTVLITDEKGCVSSTSTYVLIVGMEEVNSEKDVLIYPNPSNGSFTIEWLNNQIAGELKIEIRNTIGQLIFSEDEHLTSTHWKKQVDLCSEATHCILAGIYFVKISVIAPSENSGTVLINKKLVVVK